MSVHTWIGAFGVPGGREHKDTAVWCRDPVWQEGWWNEPCTGDQGEPSAGPSLWGSVAGSSAPSPAENTCSSPLCLWFCDGLSRAGGDLCDPCWPAFHTGSEMEQSRSLVVPVSYSKVKKKSAVFRFLQLFHATRSQSASTTATSFHRKVTTWADNKPAW